MLEGDRAACFPPKATVFKYLLKALCACVCQVTTASWSLCVFQRCPSVSVGLRPVIILHLSRRCCVCSAPSRLLCPRRTLSSNTCCCSTNCWSLMSNWSQSCHSTNPQTIKLHLCCSTLSAWQSLCFRYLLYWKGRFLEQPVTDFCSVFRTNSTGPVGQFPDHTLGYWPRVTTDQL